MAKEMTLPKAIKTLQKFQKWRRGANIEILEPKLIGEALDIAIKNLKKKK